MEIIIKYSIELVYVSPTPGNVGAFRKSTSLGCDSCSSCFISVSSSVPVDNMSHVVRKPFFRVFDTNQAVQSQKMSQGLENADQETDLGLTGCFVETLTCEKPAFCICQNKGADQLRDNRAADQSLGFRYIDSIIILLP